MQQSKQTESPSEDESILAALKEINCAQMHIRRTMRQSVDYVVYHYQSLPESVRHRLTMLSPALIERIQRLSEKTHAAEIAEELANEEATGQVIRAMKFYREKVGEE